MLGSNRQREGLKRPLPYVCRPPPSEPPPPPARGAEPTSDHGGTRGKLRKVAYHRGANAYWASVRGREHRIGRGSMPTMTAGGMHVMFANGPFIYLYAVSNDFGKTRPQGYCPAGQGQINDLVTSSRGNYIVFSCSGGNAYLTYIGPK